MTAVLTPDQARRRFVGLTALRWLPVGVAVPVSVLLATARGLSPADIGLVVALYGAVTLVLELPTGGLADAIGHRPVLALSGLFTTAGLATMAVADSVLLFAVAWALKGVARALDSGPLEAWYVDTVHRTDPDADLTPGLSRAGAADAAGLTLGAVLGGVLPLLAGRDGAAALALPLLLAAGFAMGHVVAVLLLVVPVSPDRASSLGALRAGVREVPLVVSSTVRLVLRDRLLRLLLTVSLLVGIVLTSLELLGPLHFAELAGSPEVGSAVFGVVTAISFAAAAVGSLLAPAAGRAAGGSVVLVSAVTSVLAAGAIAAFAVAPGVVLAAVAYSAFYLLNGAAWPLRKQLMHDQTTSSQRSTTVSASSLALMVGGILGNLLLPRLADSAGLPTGLLAGAAGMLLLALVSLGLRARPAGVGRPAQRSAVAG
ncbi:MFS transporter [Blastococcus haudaquaticus]|uniref:Major Facilitator Superfamily protein n=1 Tax=Blastococcus haudaquaticus TaxID=1938745 RepID=A0A286H4B8_9ACTN|nr:MFS transporter [Blastococcus haudaquaticus]SOE02542.1 Major Facilitator Superfamily protein [Blastococcus haudaquaticus]